MGRGEENIPAKTAKPASSTQEIPTTPSYAEWSSSMQAFYGAGATPPPFFASTVASPTPHPYLWGSQHPLMPPYGTPVPYPAIYPPGGVYAHASMATTPTTTPTNTEPEGKGHEGKGGSSAKKLKGTRGGKAGEIGKATSGTGNDDASQSAESGSEDSSDASDENGNQQELAGGKKGSFDQMLADANAQNSNDEAVPASVHGKPVVSMPATNLNIGMDLWNASSAGGAAKLRTNPTGASPAVAPAGMMPDQWVQVWTQDERELKRQKRKQSNRESARRSRLRKQAECEELQARVENLNAENRNLRDDLQRICEECEKLTSENNSIKDELSRFCGSEAVANIEQSNPTQPCGEEGNS